MKIVRILETLVPSTDQRECCRFVLEDGVAMLEPGTTRLSQAFFDQNGIVDGRDEKRYYPKDGIRFMEALKYEFCGFMITATDVLEES